MEKTAGDGECYSSHNARRSGPGVMRRCCLRLFVRESVRALEIHGHCSATTTGVETADWVDTHKADAQARNNTHEQCTTEHLNDTSRRRRVHLSECYRARLAEKAEQEVANLHSIRFVFSLWGGEVPRSALADIAWRVLFCPDVFVACLSHGLNGKTRCRQSGAV